MRECAHLVPHLHQYGANQFSDTVVRSLETLPKGWLRGSDLNRRPLGYENILVFSSMLHGFTSCSLTPTLFGT